MMMLWMLATAGDAWSCELDSLREPLGELPPMRKLGPSAGSAALGVNAFPVQSKITTTYTYTVGKGGLSAGDIIRLEDPHFHGIRWAKWGYLSTLPADCTPLDPDSPSGGLITASHSGGESVSIQTQRNTNGPGIHDYGYTDVTITEGELTAGETLTFLIGDLSGGSDCGLQSSPRSLREVPWRMLEKLDGSSEWTEISPPPTFTFYTDRPPSLLLITLPSQAESQEALEVRVAVLDDLGNPKENFTGSVTLSSSLEGDSLPELQFTEEDRGVQTFQWTPSEEGVLRMSGQGPASLRGDSNPSRVEEELPLRKVYWGDLHTHHGHSYVDELGELRDQNHDYGRDVIGLHVGCETLKASPHELDWVDLWPEFQQSCEDYTEDDRYIALLGFEWMGNENSPGEEGHHNVYYDGCDGPLGENSITGLTGSEISLWSFIDEVEAEYDLQAVTLPHAPLYTGSNWRDRHDTRRPLVEVYSEWGDSTVWSERGSSVSNAVGRGQRLGFFAASDNHDGWLGNRWASYYAPGGLGAFVALDLSRQGLFEAMRARSSYATTGHRPVLEFWLEDGAEIPMGAEYIAEEPLVRWRYAGERMPLRVDLYGVSVEEGSEVGPEPRVLMSWKPEEQDAEGSWEYSQWSGDVEALWLHVREEQNEEAWSSPIWLQSDCDAPGVQDLAGRCEEGADTDSPFDSGGEDSRGSDSGDRSGSDTGSLGEEGCGCRQQGSQAWLFLILLPAVVRRTSSD